MMIYRTKYLAQVVATSDEVAVFVGDGWMLISKTEYRKWKRR